MTIRNINCRYPRRDGILQTVTSLAFTLNIRRALVRITHESSLEGHSMTLNESHVLVSGYMGLTTQTRSAIVSTLIGGKGDFFYDPAPSLNSMSKTYKVGSFLGYISLPRQDLQQQPKCLMNLNPQISFSASQITSLANGQVISVTSSILSVRNCFIFLRKSILQCPIHLPTGTRFLTLQQRLAQRLLSNSLLSGVLYVKYQRKSTCDMDSL
ncbi:hypothetical protein F5B20DRAFT_542246 [Whalleya microplaca]|nr:hypothetical protein F5B20DRAFT_542246 [Whalleya microplaca]